MNHNLGEYHVPTSADVEGIEVISVDEEDKADPRDVKGLGEIGLVGLVGLAAEVANAVHHATACGSAACRSPWTRSSAPPTRRPGPGMAPPRLAVRARGPERRA